MCVEDYICRIQLKQGASEEITVEGSQVNYCVHAFPVGLFGATPSEVPHNVPCHISGSEDIAQSHGISLQRPHLNGISDLKASHPDLVPVKESTAWTCPTCLCPNSEGVICAVCNRQLPLNGTRVEESKVEEAKTEERPESQLCLICMYLNTSQTLR